MKRTSASEGSCPPEDLHGVSLPATNRSIDLNRLKDRQVQVTSYSPWYLARVLVMCFFSAWLRDLKFSFSFFSAASPNFCSVWAVQHDRCNSLDCRRHIDDSGSARYTRQIPWETTIQQTLIWQTIRYFLLRHHKLLCCQQSSLNIPIPASCRRDCTQEFIFNKFNSCVRHNCSFPQL